MAIPQQRRPLKGEKLSAQTVQDVIDVSEGITGIGGVRNNPPAQFTLIGEIVESGPNGERDFCDCRYWVKMRALSTAPDPAFNCDVTPPPPPDDDDPPPPPPPGGGGNPPLGEDGGPISPVGAPDNPHGDPDNRPPILPKGKRFSGVSKGTAEGSEVTGLATMWVDYSSENSPWFPAINIAEVRENTHDLPVGSVVIVFSMSDKSGRTFAAFNPGGGGSGGGSKRVIIERVVAQPEDALNDTHTTNFDNLGPYLSCYELDGFGNPITDVRLVVFPPDLNSANKFKNGTEHIYSINNPLPAVFTAIRHMNRWYLAFAEASILTTPPAPLQLCLGNVGVDVGACCHVNAHGFSWCVDMPESVCLEQGGFYNGDMTTCNTATPWHVTCDIFHHACCGDFEGAPGGPLECREMTSLECSAAMGTLHPGSHCTKNFCTMGGPDDIGACCILGGGCIDTTMEACADTFGGTFKSGHFCHTTTCAGDTGACCQQDGSDVNCFLLTEEQCCLQQAGPLCVLSGDEPEFKGSGTVCPDACMP